MSRVKNYLTSLFRWFHSGKPVDFVEIKRDSRYIILMEVPSDLTPAERVVLMDAVEDMRASLNSWMEKEDEKFTTILTVRGMPISVFAVKEEDNGTDD